MVDEITIPSIGGKWKAKTAGMTPAGWAVVSKGRTEKSSGLRTIQKDWFIHSEVKTLCGHFYQF